MKVDAAHPPRHTPREMQMAETFSAKSAQDWTAGEAEQALVFFVLRRLGFAPTWEQAGDVLIESDAPDPQSAVSVPVLSANSSPSAATGG